MANIDDLDHESITEMSIDEAIELLRQVRLSRRMPASSRPATIKKIKSTISTQSVDAATASELLKILEGK